MIRVCLVVLLVWAGMLHAQGKTPIELSDNPETQRSLMQVPDGFEIQLVADEPTVVNPLQINFDAQGRLWVLCAPRYPQLLPGQEPNDYVVILEDFDAKGKARKSRVFVDGLMVPTGMMPGDGGVYVGQGEALYHFRDTKGTGKANERRVLLSGFGTADTHHTLNTFRWGPDGALYFNQGLYTHSSVETPFGPRKLFGGCIWRLQTDRLKLDVYDRSILPNNTWGHAFDAWGQSFIASAWPGALNLVLPDSPLHKNTNNDLVPRLKSTQIGAERHCGLEIVSGRHLPDDWQGNLLTGDFLSHRVYRYQLNDDGTRFVAKPLAPLVQSKHRKFRPIDIKQGPDGAIYIADLYQQIIQHNQVDFRDPRRGHERGRIWRVVRTDRPLTPMPKLVGVPLDEVVQQLAAPEEVTRQLAKRVLAESDHDKAASALERWLGKLDPKDANFERNRLEALWAYQGIDHVNTSLLTKTLASDNPHVRAAATRVLAAWHDRLPDALALLARQASDPQPRVRLEAVLAAGHMPVSGALPAALKALDLPVDPFLDYALRRTAVLLEPYWYKEFKAGRLTFAGNTKQVTFALQAIRAPDAVPLLINLYQSGKAGEANQVEVLQLIAALGNPTQQAMVWEAAHTGKGLTATQQARLLAGIETLARDKKFAAPKNADKLQSLFSNPEPEVAAAALRLAGAWKLESLRSTLAKEIANENPPRRQAAVDGLVSLGGPASASTLEAHAAKPQPYAIRLAAITGLAALDTALSARLASELLSEAPPPGQDPSRLYAEFLGSKGGATALVKALTKTPPAPDAAKIGLRVLVSLGTPEPDLTRLLHNAAGVAGKERKLDAEAVKRLLALLPQADPHRGEEVFRRPALGCFQCHALGGAGGRIGPDLSGIGTSAQPDYLLESILLPSKIIREGYTTAQVFTTSGKVFTGILQRESPKELVLRDPQRDDIVIPQDDIEEKKIGGSLMPNGLDHSLTDAELVDLVRFLSELGKPGPFGVTHVRVARRWQMLLPSPTVPSPSAEKALEDPQSLWSPLYSKTSGTLPLGEVARSLDKQVGLVRGQIEVVSPGKVALQFDNPGGLKLWLDGAPLESGAPVALTRGLHTLAVRIDFSVRTDLSLRCELADVPGSPAQARFVDGK